MPYRYFLIPTIFITLLYFGITYLYSKPNPIIIIILIGLCAAIMSFQNLINDWWFSKFNPMLEQQEIMWLEQFVQEIIEIYQMMVKMNFFRNWLKCLKNMNSLKWDLKNCQKNLNGWRLAPCNTIKNLQSPKVI